VTYGDEVTSPRAAPAAGLAGWRQRCIGLRWFLGLLEEAKWPCDIRETHLDVGTMDRITPSKPGLPTHRNRPVPLPRAVAQVSMLAGQAVLLAALALAPWFFGSVQARVRVWLFGGVLVALFCWLISRLAAPARGVALPMAVVPLAGAIGLGLVQLVPWDHGTAALLSPAGVALRDSLLPSETADTSAVASSAAVFGVAAGAERQPLSLYPAATRRDLAMLILAVTVFVLGAALFQSPRAQLWLCGLIAVNGAALAFFGLVQKLTWNGLLYWTVPLTQGGAPFGPFVNRNHGAAFLNLCLAGAVALMIGLAVGHRSDGSEPGAGGLRKLRPSFTGWWQQLLDGVARLNGRRIVLLGLTGCMVGGILCSLSRGGGIAMVGATILTILVTLCARGRALRWWSIGLVAAAGLGLVGWVGMSDAVQARFATLLDAKTATHTRIPHWRDGLKAAGDFWPSGSGLGTYRYVYRPYQERPSGSWYHHAENHYLEALVEGGVVGLGLVLTMIGLVGAAAWRLVRHGPDARSFAFGIAGVFALASQAIHGFFDFALFIPANMVLFALLCGAVSGRAAELGGRRGATGEPTLRRAGWLPRVLAVGLLAAGLWGVMETRSVAAVEGALRETRFTQSPEKVSPRVLGRAIDRLEEAVAEREDDAEAQHRMATVWIHRYRARAYERLREEFGVTGDDPRLWQATSLAVLHGRAQQLARSGRTDDWSALRDEPIVKDHLEPALEHLAGAGAKRLSADRRRASGDGATQRGACGSGDGRGAHRAVATAGSSEPGAAIPVRVSGPSSRSNRRSLQKLAAEPGPE